MESFVRPSHFSWSAGPWLSGPWRSPGPEIPWLQDRDDRRHTGYGRFHRFLRPHGGHDIPGAASLISSACWRAFHQPADPLPLPLLELKTDARTRATGIDPQKGRCPNTGSDMILKARATGGSVQGVRISSSPVPDDVPDGGDIQGEGR